MYLYIDILNSFDFVLVGEIDAASHADTVQVSSSNLTAPMSGRDADGFTG